MDGYQKMFELMRRAGREGQPEGLRLRLGRVVSAAPLTVNVGGTEQEALACGLVFCALCDRTLHLTKKSAAR